jgi:tRNA threonylcarbamoyl adenosine modification protein YeaZ
MWILGFETSTERSGIALLRDAVHGSEVLFPKGFVQGREIVARVRELLDVHGLRAADVGGIAVGIGPGSFTGTRVGVTAAKSLAFALRVPAVGVSSLEVLAATVRKLEPGVAGGRGADIVTVLDARRSRFYGARFRAGAGGPGLLRRLDADAVLSWPTLSGWLSGRGTIAGDAAAACRERAAAAEAPIRDRWGVAAETGPSPSVLVEVAFPALAGATFDPEAVHALEPSYLLATTTSGLSGISLGARSP